VPLTVLVIEDESDLLETIEYNLQNEGFRTRTALNGEDGIRSALMDPAPDLILLDIMLPDVTGIEVCRRLKQTDKTKRVPIIMVTARGEEIDKVVGFESGADDYVVKPFSVRELMLRIKAVLKRSSSPSDDTELSEFGVLRIDHPAHMLKVEDEEVPLTALEFKLLVTLLNRKGRVQSRDMLLNDVWGIESEVTTRTVDTHIKRLRQKIGSAGDYIETIRGVGYRFRSKPEEDDI